MSNWNVPDDWGCYYETCPNCGSRYHLSEGGCYCFEEEAEQKAADTWKRLRACRVESVESETSPYGLEMDDLGDLDVGSGDLVYRVFITEPGNECDELVFSENSWDEIKKGLERKVAS